MKYKDFEYKTINNNIAITRYYGNDENVIISSEINDRPVTIISNSVVFTPKTQGLFVDTASGRL